MLELLAVATMEELPGVDADAERFWHGLGAVAGGWSLPRQVGVRGQSLALREFRFVAANDPSNLDAARELRLHDIRKQTSPESPPNAGLFGRLFKR